MLPCGMLGNSAADGDKLHVDLQRGIAEQTRKLRFGSDFGGHKIQNKNAQRADILSCRALVVHNKNIFICQNSDSRQIAGDPYWHLYTCFYQSEITGKGFGSDDSEPKPGKLLFI